MNKVFIPVIDRGGAIAIYGNKFFTELSECLSYIIVVRRSLEPGELLYYKTLTLAE